MPRRRGIAERLAGAEAPLPVGRAFEEPRRECTDGEGGTHEECGLSPREAIHVVHRVRSDRARGSVSKTARADPQPCRHSHRASPGCCREAAGCSAGARPRHSRAPRQRASSEWSAEPPPFVWRDQPFRWNYHLEWRPDSNAPCEGPLLHVLAGSPVSLEHSCHDSAYAGRDDFSVGSSTETTAFTPRSFLLRRLRDPAGNRGTAGPYAVSAPRHRRGGPTRARRSQARRSARERSRWRRRSPCCRTRTRRRTAGGTDCSAFSSTRR